MTWCDGYSEREKRAALARLIRDMDLPIGKPLHKRCHECGEDAEWHPFESAEDGMCRGDSPAGYYCVCGWRELEDWR